MYQNQFQKYQPEPFVEQDVPTHVMNDDGPVISPSVCRAAMQRSVGKILYNTGFEEFQPSALEAITDVATDFFHKIGVTLKAYMETPKVPVDEATPSTLGPSAIASTSSTTPKFKSPYTCEEMILHTLASVGTDVESLEAYVKDDVDRMSQKLGVISDRLKGHLTELLRPAFNEGGDGSHAFEDGSQQFVGGDFAEDIDEDFFGFKELGLDKEFGLASLSVPLHLLQNRMYHAHQAQNTRYVVSVSFPSSLTPSKLTKLFSSSSQITSTVFPTPPAYPPITMQTLPLQIGLVQNFYRAKLESNKGEPLTEDLELPPKQRPTATRPRVPASGKIPSQPLPAITNSSNASSNNTVNAAPTSSTPAAAATTTATTTNNSTSTAGVGTGAGTTNGQTAPQSSPLKRPAPPSKRDKLQNSSIKQPRLV